MKTTIRIDESLLRQARRRAASMGKSVTDLVEEAIRAVLPTSAPRRRNSRVRLTTVKGHGLQRGVNLDNSASLLDLMERSDASH
jgi:Arc/MetJ family transcription regulator